MAHKLVDFDSACRAICSPHIHTRTELSRVTLNEIFLGGRLISQAVGDDLPAISENSIISIVHSSHQGDSYEGMSDSVGLRVSIFKLLTKAIRLPLIYPETLISNTATFFFATPQVPTTLSRKRVDQEHLCFILQFLPGGFWPGCFSASFTYDFPRRHLYVFLQTYESQNTVWGLEEIPNLAQLTNHHGSTPLLLPSAMLKLHLQGLLRGIDRYHHDLYDLEQTMGIRATNYSNEKERPPVIDLRTLNFSEIFRAINGLNANLAWIQHSCQRANRMLDFMDKVAEKYKEKATDNGFAADEAEDTEQELLDAHAYLRSWNKGLEQRVEYLFKRSSALSQSVYSGIAQRDSADSIELSKMSTKLAETSQDVAIATSRDSAVMRVIGAVTIAFLPGTFVATFFSTSFFNFGEGIDGRVYSKWLWLYFVMTFGFTALVMGGTWILWRRKEKDIERMDGKEKPKTKEA